MRGVRAQEARGASADSPDPCVRASPLAPRRSLLPDFVAARAEARGIPDAPAASRVRSFLFGIKQKARAARAARNKPPGACGA